MSLGTTLTVTLDGSGGTAKVLPLISTLGTNTEYFLDDGLVTYRAKIRHSEDSVKAGTQPFNRHSVTFERYLKPTTTAPLGRLTQVTFTIRTDPNEVVADVVDVSEAMSFYMVKAGNIAGRLIGLES